MSRINVGIVGTGGMGKIHATAYMKNKEAYVYGVCSINRELAQDFADGKWESVAYSEGEMSTKFLYRIERVYDDYGQLAADPNIHAVSVVTPNVLHHEIVMEMLRNKKHVIVEKPLAINAKQAGEIVGTAREKGVVIATGHMWRYHKDVQYMKKIIEEGILGDIVQTKSYGLHLRWGPDGWFSQKSTAGGGALIDMGVHAIDTTRYITGDPDIKSVYASVGSRFRSIDVDDFAQIMVKHYNGVVSLFESGWNFPYISGPEASTEIWGTKGYGRIFPTFIELKVGGEWGRFTPA
ncbi:MAG: Gfo/Idh/MocA family oxidoreductase, partial [Firmicutes bacterium]|nr:Gfo/Idh/MocA family oxidoreductase [Bacillota bacterium]